jgi:hypothetical protein
MRRVDVRPNWKEHLSFNLVGDGLRDALDPRSR